MTTGNTVRQIEAEAKNFPTVPQTQGQALQDLNVLGGANDAHIAATYTESAIRRLQEA
ncbi:hypothetical protein [Agromyces albus]|uniref:hypothetical protein n=1 Tax=Agromyces albus TaxID=205332 RepID=UPI0027D8B040|nr:hypothetical protein [Agromyces albus]